MSTLKVGFVREIVDKIITFRTYLEIDMALTKIRTEHDCSTIIGYGHSTGALALLNYLR